MKVKIIKPCKDKITGAQYNVGDIVDLSEERIKEAPSGLVEVVAEEKKAAPKKKATTKKESK